jgi:hypothetical protein
MAIGIHRTWFQTDPITRSHWAHHFPGFPSHFFFCWVSVEHFPHQPLVNVCEHSKQLKQLCFYSHWRHLPASVAVALADHLVDFNHVTISLFLSFHHLRVSSSLFSWTLALLLLFYWLIDVLTFSWLQLVVFYHLFLCPFSLDLLLNLSWSLWISCPWSTAPLIYHPPLSYNFFPYCRDPSIIPIYTHHL